MKILTIVLLLISQLAWSSNKLYTVPDGNKLILKVKFNTPETGDLYVAKAVDNKIIFYNQAAGWTESKIAFMTNQSYQGEYTLLSVPTPANYQFYQVVTIPNTDPFKSENWIGGSNGLSSLSVNLPFQNNDIKVLAFNDLGMHCIDKEFSIFSILPPFNVVNAQVLIKGREPRLLNSDQVELRYSPVADSNNSINSNSIGKTDFWQYAPKLFGKNLQPGEGLTGLYMPADNPNPQKLHYNNKHAWFSAEGIPITPIDDKGQVNPYPMLRINAHDKQTGALLAGTDVVVPVSSETDCQNCHASGKRAANDPTVAWANDADLEVQTKKNILILHDKEHKTDLKNQTPVLCAGCHYSPALDLDGSGPQGKQKELPTSSQVMHKFHGELRDEQGNLIFPDNAPVEKTCYQCHPGQKTQCQRGAMKTEGLECNACHGGMKAVGGQRRSWVDLPKCQSCHTGDAMNHLNEAGLVFGDDKFRLKQTYKIGDSTASPLNAINKRFAENDNTLYRNSKGHGGIACEGCHGSPHAIWPNATANANDNITAKQLQGHVGTVIECDSCHTPGSLPMTTKGPHGLHNVNDPRWVDEEHEDFYKRNPDGCKACHGADLKGTDLAKVAADRSFRVEGRIVNLQKGQKVSCNICHRMPGEGHDDDDDDDDHDDDD